MNCPICDDGIDCPENHVGIRFMVAQRSSITNEVIDGPAVVFGSLDVDQHSVHLSLSDLEAVVAELKRRRSA